MATHGCVLRNGTLQSFDVPSSTFTQAWDINPGANIVGDFKDSAGVFHGFLQTGVHRHEQGYAWISRGCGWRLTEARSARSTCTESGTPYADPFWSS